MIGRVDFFVVETESHNKSVRIRRILLSMNFEYVGRLYLKTKTKEQLSFIIEKVFKVRDISNPVRVSFFFSFIIIDLFLKNVRNFDRFYSFICESKFVFDV